MWYLILTVDFRNIKVKLAQGTVSESYAYGAAASCSHGCIQYMGQTLWCSSMSHKREHCWGCSYCFIGIQHCRYSSRYSSTRCLTKYSVKWLRSVHPRHDRSRVLRLWGDRWGRIEVNDCIINQYPASIFGEVACDLRKFVAFLKMDKLYIIWYLLLTTNMPRLWDYQLDVIYVTTSMIVMRHHIL